MMASVFRTHPALAFLLLGLPSAGQSQGAENDLEALRRLMGPLMAVKVETKTTLTEAKDGTPPQRGDRWTFISGGAGLTVSYSRFLNQPPDFRGSYPSLANEDMGVGFDGGPFHYWYAGNAIRVMVNGEDIMRARPAKLTKAAEGDPGRLRLVWDLAGGGELRLSFAVPDGGAAVYARIELAPATLAVSSFQVRLTCYPGGFGPAYGHPSHRWALTAKGEAGVPKDFVQTADNALPVLPLPAGEGWVFYADKLQSRGSLGLILLPEERAAGEVRLSSYGVSTVLTCPPNARTLHLGFLAFDTANAAAQQAFVASVTQEQRVLRTVMIDSPYLQGEHE
jgi:hypothetical protein